MPRFSANLGFLFLEGSSIIEQYQLAAKCGFRAVEHPFPPKDVDKTKLLEVKNALGIEVALVNIETDPEHKFGCASIPKQQESFKRNFKSSVEFAKLFDCKKIHLMSGKLESSPTKEHHETFVENLKFAAEILERENLVGVIEPINHYSVPGYFLHDYKYAVDTIKTVGSDNIKLMADLFHMQMIQGNIANSLKDFQPFIGHVQIAQAPNRNEPNSPGELNLKFILDNIDYDGFIGCEYKPVSSAENGLGWVKEFGYELWKIIK